MINLQKRWFCGELHTVSKPSMDYGNLTDLSGHINFSIKESHVQI